MLAGQLQKAPPFAPQPLSGGALADEMGLGKTVITLALILKRPPPAGWRAPLALAQPPPTPTLALPHALLTPSTPAPLAQPPQTPNLAEPGATTLLDPAPSAQTPLGSQGLRRNGATLIAATPALLGQWDNEVCPFCESVDTTPQSNPKSYGSDKVSLCMLCEE